MYRNYSPAYLYLPAPSLPSYDGGKNGETAWKSEKIMELERIMYKGRILEHLSKKILKEAQK